MNSITKKWGALGIAFVEESTSNVDPEQLILESLPYFAEDRKLLALVCCWLLKHSSLIHVERLKKLASKINDAKCLSWLGGVSHKISKNDHRWGILTKFGLTDTSAPLSEWDNLQGQKKGFDEDFLPYGIKIAKFEMNYEKKLLSDEKILEKNPIFSLRSLIGVNWRADIIWLKFYKPDTSLYGVAKTLGCNHETVYRLWREIERVGSVRVMGALSMILPVR